MIEAEPFEGEPVFGLTDIRTNPFTDKADGRTLFIPTLEGVMTAEVGDWIIRGVKGELYPCKPDIFCVTYEAADALPLGI